MNMAENLVENYEEEKLIKKYINYKRKLYISITVSIIVLSVIFLFFFKKIRVQKISSNIVEKTITDYSDNKEKMNPSNKENVYIVELPIENEVSSQSHNNSTASPEKVNNTEINNINIKNIEDITSINKKPSNKKFLFDADEGYTIENVMDKAKTYLGTWNGEIKVLKDQEGVVLGVEVIVY